MHREERSHFNAAHVIRIHNPCEELKDMKSIIASITIAEDTKGNRSCQG